MRSVPGNQKWFPGTLFLSPSKESHIMKTPRINQTIKRISMLIILISAAVIGGVIISGKAHADGYLSPQEEYFGDLIAETLCDYIDGAGVTESSMEDALRVIYRNTPAYMDVGDAADIINYTVYNYCPRHWSKLQAFGAGARSQQYA